MDNEHLDVTKAVAIVENIKEIIDANKEFLTKLDSAIGDADHGINMSRGFTKALEKVRNNQYNDIGAVFKDVAMTLMSTVGGAAGPLYGTFFMRASMKLAGLKEADLTLLAQAFREGLQGVVALGKAQLGDKTMVDALTPAIEALEAAAKQGLPLKEGLKRALDMAEKGMKDTIPLVARKGRASYLGERSAGHQDPGATSSYLILKAICEALGV
ncbi:dihydroxyacetone kinase DhaL subunit [Acetomicrobium mobile DSM 13181]|uniref:Dihydroxyacetone kinase DhaL subunit n=1 Tax=Acetomicrobium mobile (strain ATCC BAA-54 / DSM 13181 / JCM 12221 / NGA) TaxID=891968 RepID=I4BYG6_ACEMN|nr:dihydroxyacetone kinase subunit DhaL [Acetomicrobium mobile]AFM22323.1 dihydroxyacetone kinase DhaL subunit [Acetomicrobium mobile DSM 13181]